LGINGNDQAIFAKLEKCSFLSAGFSQVETKLIKQTLRDKRITKFDDLNETMNLAKKLELASYHFIILKVDAGDNAESLSKIVASHRFENTPIIIISKTPEVYRNSYSKKKMIGQFVELPLTAGKLEDAILNIARTGVYERSQVGNLSEVLDHFNNGTKAFDEENLDEAEKEFTLCIKADATFIDGYLKLADVVIAKKDFSSAMKVLKKAVGIDKHNAEIFFLVGIIHCENDKKDSAVSAFNKGVEAEPDNVHMIIDMGNACLDKSWVEEALHFFNMAKSKNPEYIHVYNRIGIALSRAGKFEDAEKEYERAIEIDPSDAGVRFNIGMMWTRRKDNGKAADFFKKAFALDPTLEEAKEMLKKVGG
jgi:tetratricopeptide (TPR) repeat protein